MMLHRIRTGLRFTVLAQPVLFRILREKLTLCLLVLLPLHAFAVTVLTRVIAGPGHSPLLYIVLWKEIVLCVLIALAILELLQSSVLRREALQIDVLDMLVGALCITAFIVSLSTYQGLHPIAYGIKYDFVPLLAFIVLRRVSWSKDFAAQVMMGLLGIGVIIAFYGFITYALPVWVFSYLGYSDLHSLYNPDGALAPFQQIGGLNLRRLQSTMSGPNQFGIWLLVPLGIACITALKRHYPSNALFARAVQFLGIQPKGTFIVTVLVVVLLAAQLLTFSRSAWIASAIVIFVASVQHFDHDQLRRALVRYSAILVFIVFLVVFFFPGAIVRTASTMDHLQKPIAAVKTMWAHPLGLGLGSAGPASNRVSDTCVVLPEGADYSWASHHEHLCVFLGASQVQPDAPCSCPVLPENWYLQIGVELGWIGMILYVFLIGGVLWALAQKSEREFDQVAFLSFLGVSIAALFLHAWESAAITYTVWILCAVSLRVQAPKPSPSQA